MQTHSIMSLMLPALSLARERPASDAAAMSERKRMSSTVLSPNNAGRFYAASVRLLMS